MKMISSFGEASKLVQRHPCPSEEYGGAVGGSSTEMEQGALG